MRALLLIGLCAGSAWAAAWKVKTVDQQQLPVSGASVVARHRATGWSAQCKTAQDGTCELQVEPAGAFVVEASTGELVGRAESAVAEASAGLTVVLEPAALRTVIQVVSGSRQEELQDESPVKVEAVTREQMLTTGYERVSDVLQEMPGVLIRRGSTPTVGGEQIQGVDSRQVLVLQDGLPVVGARGIKSGALNLNRQSSDRLNRIEVVKGSASSLYGSDAIGGVINMITREPSEGLQLGAVASGGTLGVFDGRGDVGGRRGGWSFFADGGQSRMDSYRLIPNSTTTVGPKISRQDILAKTRYQFHPKFALGFTANAYRNRETGRNAGETGLVDGVNLDSVQSYAVVADWIPDASTTVQGRVYLARYDEDSLTTPVATPGATSQANLNEKLNRVDGTLSRQLGRSHFAQAGVEWAQTDYRGVNRIVGDNIGQQVSATDVWVQDKWTPNSRVTITGGGRVTRHSLFGTAAVPKIGANLRLTDRWILRGSFGMGFRAPDLGQLYYRFANPASFYQVIGNPNLAPEHSQSFQAGTLYRARRYRLGVTLFRNNIRDLIESRLVGTPRTTEELNAILTAYGIPAMFNPLLGRQTFVYLNQSRVFTQGVELDGEYSFARRLRVGAAYTYLNALDRLTHLALPQRHRHQGQVRADYLVPKLGITTNVRGSFYSHWVLNAAAGTRGLPYQIWDAYAGRNLGRGVQVFLAVDNLNNSRDSKLRLASPSYDRPDYGRMWRVGLRYRFRSSD